MTTEQKLAYLQRHVDQATNARTSDLKVVYINQGRGALGAWFADMTLSHEQYQSFYKTFQDLEEKCSD